MKSRSIEDRAREVIREQLGTDPAHITPEKSFRNDLGADSLDCVELLVAFEEEFGLSIPPEEAEPLVTVGKAIDYLKGRCNAKGGEA